MKSRRGSFESLIEQLWFDPQPPLLARTAGLVLGPLCALTRWYAGRQRSKIEATQRRQSGQRPITIVIGNLVAGGAGKTPLTIALCRQLIQRQRRVGIICRGDGAVKLPSKPVEVRWPADSNKVGDEAVLMARTTGAPVVACRDRGEALKAIHARHPDLDIVLSDDGLQHVGLHRHIEVAVFGPRGTGNGRLLPAGPLREPIEHLARMDAVVSNHGLKNQRSGATRTAAIEHPRRFSSQSTIADLIPLNEYLHSAAGTDLAALPEDTDWREWIRGRGLHTDQPVAALAGIANPEAFFDLLRSIGLTVIPYPRADHEHLTQQSLSAIEGSQLIMTEKDAVKCRHLSDPRAFVLRIVAQPEPDLVDWLLLASDEQARRSPENTKAHG